MGVTGTAGEELQRLDTHDTRSAKVRGGSKGSCIVSAMGEIHAYLQDTAEISRLEGYAEELERLDADIPAAKDAAAAGVVTGAESMQALGWEVAPLQRRRRLVRRLRGELLSRAALQVARGAA